MPQRSFATQTEVFRMRCRVAEVGTFRKGRKDCAMARGNRSIHEGEGVGKEAHQRVMKTNLSFRPEQKLRQTWSFVTAKLRH